MCEFHRVPPDYADQNGAEDANCRFVLEEVTTLPIALTNLSAWNVEGNYTTLYLPVKVKISDEAVAYALVANSASSFDMVALTNNVVPANTGVVLAGNYATATATVTTEDADAAAAVLKGTCAAINRPSDNVYVLSVANDKLGFYKFEGAEMKGFRAYYEGTSPDPTRGFVLNFGETTGINAVTLNGEGNAYDLQGRRVQNAQKGIFIINGKKVVK